jgi:hypothetical protein
VMSQGRDRHKQSRQSRTANRACYVESPSAFARENRESGHSGRGHGPQLAAGGALRRAERKNRGRGIQESSGEWAPHSGTESGRRAVGLAAGGWNRECELALPQGRSGAGEFGLRVEPSPGQSNLRRSEKKLPCPRRTPARTALENRYVVALP